jgi:hypothetical protein
MYFGASLARMGFDFRGKGIASSTSQIQYYHLLVSGLKV